MMMTSLTSAARLLLRPTVALVDHDYQFYTRRYLSSSKMMKCLFKTNIWTARMRLFSTSTCLSSKIILTFGDFFNANICTAGMRFLLRLVSKLFSAKFGFSPLFRLYGLLNGFLSRIWTYFLEWSLALDPTPSGAPGSATSQGLGWKCLIFPRWGTDGSS